MKTKVQFRLAMILATLLFSVNIFAQGNTRSPELSVTPNPYTFDTTYVGETISAYFTFENTGTDSVIITDITFTNYVFSIDYTSFTIAPGESGELPVHFTPSTVGDFDGVMEIYSNDPDNNPYEVQLYGVGIVEIIDGWEWIQTPYDYILTDIEFPEGQNMIGYCVGQKNTYNGEGIVIKTTDGGDTWERMTDVGLQWLTASCFIDINTGYAAGWGGTIIKTTDGGETWETLTVNSNIYKISDIDFYDANHGVVTVYDANSIGGIYYTSDGGGTWTQGTTDTDYFMNMVDYADEMTLCAVGAEDIILRSTDGGHTWNMVNNLPGGYLLGIYFYDSKFGIASGDYGHVYKTNNGGTTWTAYQTPGDPILHAPFIWDQDTAWVVGTPESVYKSVDGGESWNYAYDGNWQRAFYRITFTDNYTGFICGSHGAVLRKEGYPEIPEINITPDTLDFGTVHVDETSTMEITITNNGFGPLEVTDITSTNDAFTVDLTSFTIPPGESQVISVTFNPSEVMEYTGAIQITSNDPDNSMVEVYVTGEGTAIYYPEIYVSTTAVTFDTTMVGDQSVEVIVVANSGEATLNVTNITTTNSVFTVNLTSFDLEPDESQAVEITFAPDEQMLYNASLFIENNDPNNPSVEVTLTGFADIETSTGEMGIDIDDEVKIYPNPARNTLYLDNVKDAKVIIYDMTGHVKFSGFSRSETMQIDVSGFDSQLYLVNIVRKNNIITKKINVIR